MFHLCSLQYSTCFLNNLWNKLFALLSGIMTERCKNAVSYWSQIVKEVSLCTSKDWEQEWFECTWHQVVIITTRWTKRTKSTVWSLVHCALCRHTNILTWKNSYVHTMRPYIRWNYLEACHNHNTHCGLEILCWNKCFCQRGRPLLKQNKTSLYSTSRGFKPRRARLSMYMPGLQTTTQNLILVSPKSSLGVSDVAKPCCKPHMTQCLFTHQDKPSLPPDSVGKAVYVCGMSQHRDALRCCTARHRLDKCRQTVYDSGNVNLFWQEHQVAGWDLYTCA